MTDQNTRPLSFDQLAQRLETERTVELPRLGPVRLLALDFDTKLRVMADLDTIERNEAGEIASQRDAVDFGIHLLSLSIADESGRMTFDSPEGRVAIGRFPVDELERLSNAAMELNGLAGEEEDQQLGQKKTG